MKQLISAKHWCALLTAAISISMTGCADGSNDEQMPRSDLHRSEQAIESVAGKAGQELRSVARSIDRNLDLKKENSDSSFVAEAATSNSEVIKLLKRGIAKGSDAGLKKEARAMLADHARLDQELHRYARSKNYPVPAGSDGKGNEDLDELDEDHKAGKDWDNAWAELIADEHQEDIQDFERARNSVHDPKLKQIVSDALPRLREHQKAGEQLQERLD